MTKERERERMVSFKTIAIQLGIIVFFSLTWLSGLIFNIGVFNVYYYIFLFISLISFVVIVLYSKDKPKPISKIPTNHFSNFIKAMTDAINVQYITMKQPVSELKNTIQNILVFALRNAIISSDFDRDILEETELYMLDNLKKEEV